MTDCGRHGKYPPHVHLPSEELRSLREEHWELVNGTAYALLCEYNRSIRREQRMRAEYEAEYDGPRELRWSECAFSGLLRFEQYDTPVGPTDWREIAAWAEANYVAILREVVRMKRFSY